MFWIGIIVGAAVIAFGIWVYVMDKLLDYMGKGR